MTRAAKRLRLALLTSVVAALALPAWPTDCSYSITCGGKTATMTCTGIECSADDPNNTCTGYSSRNPDHGATQTSNCDQNGNIQTSVHTF